MENLSPVLGGFQLGISFDCMKTDLDDFDGGPARLNADTVTGDGRAEAAPVV
ncbi:MULTISPECIES: hypothetical protein [unclassified Pseudoclavibacter]|uniref:hypothetical protein n=1 Tax=unclassified Pseudoclavibacter TaxID=2615177 RepID=UPI001BACD505|nr:hypothetical protein [Pseudoclavibacter sp. Marseille-Q4354]MBS3180017.1 hypothetical protein [Pseudoclavibacter sp. Marseille-Q4354]